MKATELIDLDAVPYCLPEWTVERHVEGGQVTWDPERMALDEHSSQNANLLDFLLSNQELIPESLKGRRIMFQGTIYRMGKNGIRFVRCLVFDENKWTWYITVLE